MTEIRVYVHTIEDMLFHGRAARIVGVRMDGDGRMFFEVEGSAIPKDAGTLIVRTVTTSNTLFEPLPPHG